MRLRSCTEALKKLELSFHYKEEPFWSDAFQLETDDVFENVLDATFVDGEAIMFVASSAAKLHETSRLEKSVSISTQLGIWED